MKIVNSRMTNPSIELNRAAKDKFCVSVKISRYHLIGIWYPLYDQINNAFLFWKPPQTCLLSRKGGRSGGAVGPVWAVVITVVYIIAVDKDWHAYGKNEEKNYQEQKA